MKSLSSFLKDEKGQTMAVQMAGLTAVTLVILLLVYFKIRNVPTLNTTDSNATSAAYEAPSGSVFQEATQRNTMLGIDDNVYSGLELMGLVVIVSAASLILALLSGV